MPLHGRHRLFQRHLNGFIASLFTCGSSLFLLAGILSLWPALAARWSLDSFAINLIFFAGSIPFTSAAYLQLFQSANAMPATGSKHSTPPKIAWFGWRPGDIGWLSCALQFAGTLLFNVNTFDALLPGLDWLQQDAAVWAPDMIGSALFLASGYLSLVECYRDRSARQSNGLAWWITLINLLGCVAFLVSAVLAFTAFTPDAALVAWSTMFTAVGAAAFLVGSLLMLPQRGVDR
jgi:hypothetical protein